MNEFKKLWEKKERFWVSVWERERKWVGESVKSVEKIK